MHLLFSCSHQSRSYKITPRSQNAHAYVNAAFKFKLNPVTSVIEERPSLVFGGVARAFNHAEATEGYLKGKNINDKAIFKKAFKFLSGELAPDLDPVLTSPEYRTYLAQALFYKVRRL